MPSYRMVRHRGNHYQPPILPRGSGLLIRDPMPSAGAGVAECLLGRRLHA